MPDRDDEGRFGQGNVLGQATRFQPGASGNPRGRPRKGLLTRELEERLLSDIGQDQPVSIAKALASALIGIALNKNNNASSRIQAIREIADRVEGRSVQPMSFEGGEGESRTDLRIVVVSEAERVSGGNGNKLLPE